MRRSAQTIRHARGWPIAARTVVVATIVCLANATIGQGPQAVILVVPDFNAFRSLFGNPLGRSGLPCAGTAPCPAP